MRTPRAKELASRDPEQLTLQGLRERYGGSGVSDDELLLRIAADKGSFEAMRKATQSKMYLGSSDPLIELINRLGAFSPQTQLTIRTSDLSIRIGRNVAAHRGAAV